MHLRKLVLTVFFLGLGACGYYREEYNADQPQILGDNSPKPLNYETVSAILQRNRCLECHSEAGRNRGRVNLESYEKVKSFAKDILDQIDMGFMPDDNGPRVSADDRKTLGEWVEAATPL